MRDGYRAFRQPKVNFGCWDMLAFMAFGARQNFYVFSLSRHSDLDDRIYDCLLTSMAAMHAEDVSASFRFVGDLNDNHMEWLTSMTMNHHRVSAFDFATVKG